MVAAAAPSTASRTRTLAPLVSAASAWFCCVGASWLALLYRTWAPQSLATSASKRGLSLLSYRAVLVSGRRSAIFFPLPLAPPLLLELPQAATIITLAAARAYTLRDLCIKFVLQPDICFVRALSWFSALGSSPGLRYSSPRPAPSRSASTTVGSWSVVVSPRARFSATSRRRRRMILPERVLGSSGVKWMGR